MARTATKQLLGFESMRPNEQADPDGIWRDDDRQWLLFEAKTEVQPERAVSAVEVRQVTTHRQWAINRYRWPEPAEATTVLITHQTQVGDPARAVSGDIYIVGPEVLRQIAERTVAVHRDIRARALGQSEEDMRGAFAAAFGERRLDTASLVTQLTRRRLAEE